MRAITSVARQTLAAVFTATLVVMPIAVPAQDLVSVNSISGMSSVFVFRSAPRVKRFVAAAKPTRTKVQRLATVSKFKKQYEILAKVSPSPNRAKPIDPTSNIKTIGPIEGSKRLAGVGEYYLDKGDLDKSIERFREAISLDPNNTSAKNGLSDVLSRKGNDLLLNEQSEGAKTAFLEALKFNPANSAAYFGLGELYAEADQFIEAISSYERSLKENKDLTEIYVPLGILYYQTGDIAKADEYLTKALAKSADQAETQYFYGLVRSSQNRVDEAMAAFVKAKTLDPAYAEAYYQYGELLMKAKRALEAVPEYKKAVELKPAYFDAWLGLGQAHYDAGNYTEAIAAFEQAAKLKNDNWEVFAGWGESNLKAGKYNDAAAKLNLGVLFLTRNKDFDKNAAADLYSKVGFAYGAQCEQDRAAFRPCQWSSAVKALEKAVELTGDPLDQANLGWAYFNWSRVDLFDRKPAEQKIKLASAKANLEKALAGNPKIQAGATQNLANVLIDSGDFAGAITILKGIVEKDPDATFAKYAMASAYALTDDNDNAAKYYREVLTKEPNFVSALKNLGVVEVKRKKGKEARQILDKLKTLSQTDAFFLENEIKKARL